MSVKQPCTLCADKGCAFHIFGTKKTSDVLLPLSIMCWIYGLPLLMVLTGAVLGAMHSEGLSIVGAILGLILAFLSLRACHKPLNRLSLSTDSGSGDSST